MKKIIYIGELPPKYNGVSIKNSLVLNNVLSGCNVSVIDMVECKRKPYKLPLLACRVFVEILSNHQIILGFGSFVRLGIIFVRYFLRGKKSLNNISIMVMGGEFHNDVRNSKIWIDIIPYLGRLWVESIEMKQSLEALGAVDVRYFPNCRNALGKRKPIENRGALKCLFFSNIYRDKGVNIIRDAVLLLKDRGISFEIDFYGEIYDEYRDTFNQFVSSEEKVRYCSVFDSVHDDIYGLMNQYDVLLFPTFWRGEGVPGVLVESKMSGITAIVSDWNQNSKIVIDKVEGIVLPNNTPECLSDAITLLAENRKLLFDLKKGAYNSSIRYDINSYRDVILK